MFMRLLCFLFVLGVVADLSAEPVVLEIGAEVSETGGEDWTLPDGQLVQLRIIEKQFHLLFLDEDRLLIEPAVKKVILRGEEARNQTNNINIVLKPGSDNTLTHVRKVYPPYDYWLMLLIPDPEKSGEWTSLQRRRFQPEVVE